MYICTINSRFLLCRKQKAIGRGYITEGQTDNRRRRRDYRHRSLLFKTGRTEYLNGRRGLKTEKSSHLIK